MAFPRAASTARHLAGEGSPGERRPPPDHPVWAAAAGDSRATHRLLEILLPRVRNLVRFVVWRDADVDDVTQEALIVVLDGLGSYRCEGALEAWVDRVVVRVALRQRQRLRQEPCVDARAPEDALIELSVRPDDEYLARRRAIAVLDQLSVDQRDAVVLHHVLGMTVPEIGDQLSLSQETVRSRLRLARARLRDGGIDPGADALGDA